MRAGREDLGDAGDLQPLLGGAEGGAKARAARADDDDVIGVIDEFICSPQPSDPEAGRQGRRAQGQPYDEEYARRRDQDPYTRWCWHNRLTPRLRSVLQADAAAAIKAGGPLISVVVPAKVRPKRVFDALEKALQGTRAILASPKPKPNAFRKK